MEITRARKKAPVDLGFLMELLKLASAAHCWRIAKSLPECETAQTGVWKAVNRLMELHSEPAPMIEGISEEEIAALLEAAALSGEGLIN